MENKEIDKELDARKELDEHKKEDLNNILLAADKDSENAATVINKIITINNTSKQRILTFARKHDLRKRLLSILVLVIWMLISVYYAYYVSEMSIFNEILTESVSISTESNISISMDNESNKLVYDVKSATVKNTDSEGTDRYTEINSTRWLLSNVDTEYSEYNIEDKSVEISKELSINSFILSDTYFYINSINENKNATKEILLSKAKPMDLDLENIPKKSLRFFEKHSSVQINSYTNSFNDSFLMLNERLGGGELSISTLKYRMDNIESKMQTSDSYRGIILNFEELGELNVSNIDGLEDTRVVYNSNDGVLRVTSDSDIDSYIYIFSINSDRIVCKAEDLLETKDSRLYINKSYDSKDSLGYRTFAIITDTNLYCFKIENESITEQVLNNFGIDKSSLAIDKIQSVIRSSGGR